MKKETEYREIPEYKDVTAGMEIRKKKRGLWKIPVLVALVTLLIVVGTVVGVGYSLINSVNKIDDDKIVYEPSDLASGTAIGTDSKDQTQETDQQEIAREDLLEDDVEVVSPEVQSLEDQVINLLLIGEEAVHDHGRGRSDTSMILTINKEQHSLKLASLMRDIKVHIPGYLDNKLNDAFKKGGGKLLKKTIEKNFGIQIDGYIIVNFEGFEDIIDELGGVEVELTESEVEYLNTHKYISKKKYRNLVPGKQVLNGNQTRGYCRIRYVVSSDHQAGDFGRTERQRRVLLNLFDKYKSKNPAEMLKLAQKLLGYVSTNLDNAKILEYITEAVTLGCDTIETLNVPVEGQGSYIMGTTTIGLGKAWAFQIDWDINRAELVNFIYGSSHMQEMGVDPSKLVSTDSQTAAKEEEKNKRKKLASSGYGTHGKVVNQTAVTTGKTDKKSKKVK